MHKPVMLVLLAAAVLTLLPHARGAVLWIEGEKPAQAQVTRHPWWYDQVKKEQLSGGDFVSNWNDKAAGELAYDVATRVGGEYDFYVRANPVATKFAYQLNGGEKKEVDLSKNQVGEVVNIAADGKIDLRFIVWVKVGKVKLKKGANRIQFTMHSDNNNHGFLDCFVLANEAFEPKGILKPGEIAAAAKKQAEADKGWVVFDPPADPFKANSAIDLRGLNEKYAGEGGFIEVDKQGHFIHAKTGKPVRFWAVNGPAGTLTDRDALKKNARLLAKYGVNLVRVHGGCYGEDGEIKPDEVKRRVDIVESMKSEGIYTHISIYFPLWLHPKADCPWLKGYNGQQIPFAALYFNPDFQKHYQEWWKAVLLAPTSGGKRLIDDPALMSVEIINEDSYFFWTFTPQNIPDPELQILESQFAVWAKKRYGSLDAAMKAWNGQKADRDKLAEGRLGFRPLWNVFSEKSQRDKDASRFLCESQRDFYQQTIKFLRGIGFKGLITASNWVTASPEVFGPLEKYSYTVGDFIDRHGYFGCNGQGDNSGWSIRDGHTYSDRSALRFESETPGKPKSFVHPAMDPHYNNMPSMISETTFCRPNRYRSEAPLYYAAYGALQDSDCIVHFALDSSTWSVKPGYFMQPWTVMTPAMTGQFPAAAMIYRQGLVDAGDVLVDLNLKIENLMNLEGTPLPQDANFDELRLKDVPQGVVLKPGNVIDPLVHFAGRTDVRFTAEGGSAKLANLSRLIDRKAQTVTASSGQLKLDYGKGLLTINAPAAQGMSGALDKAGAAALKDLQIESDLPLGHIIAVSLDGKPLATSKKILLQVMTEEKATDFRTEPAGNGVLRIASIGRDPWNFKEIQGKVRFTRSDAAKLKVTALDFNGYAARKHGTAASIDLLPGVIYYLVGAE